MLLNFFLFCEKFLSSPICFPPVLISKNSFCLLIKICFKANTDNNGQNNDNNYVHNDKMNIDEQRR